MYESFVRYKDKVLSETVSTILYLFIIVIYKNSNNL